MSQQMVLLSSRSTAPVLGTSIGGNDPFAGKRAVLWTDGVRVHAGRASVSGVFRIASYPFAEMLVVTSGTLNVTHAGQVRSLSPGMSAVFPALAAIEIDSGDGASWCFTAAVRQSAEAGSSSAATSPSQGATPPPKASDSAVHNGGDASQGHSTDAAHQAMEASQEQSAHAAAGPAAEASLPSGDIAALSPVFLNGSEDLQPSPPPAPDALTTPAPTCGALQAFSDPASGLSAGIWAATPYARHVRIHAAHELMHVIEGGMTLNDRENISLSLAQGDTVFVPKGAPCGWESTAPMRKYFAGA